MIIKPKYLAFIIFLLIAFAGFYHHDYADWKIKKEHRIICGKIISVRKDRIGFFIKYEFSIDEKNQNINSSSCLTETKNKFEGGIDNILVVFEKNNPDNNRLLENVHDFQDYRIKPKDTIGLTCNPNSVVIFWPEGYISSN